MTLLQIVLLVAGGILSGAVVVLLIGRPYVFRLRRRLLTDPTSGLPNFEGFHRYMKRHPHEKFMLFLLDLDDFRRFNHLGYDCGDEVLKRFATKLSHELSGFAFCARYRLGDEFLVVAREYELDKVRKALERINNEVVYKNDPVHFTYGVASVNSIDADGCNAIRIAHDILISKKVAQ